MKSSSVQYFSTLLKKDSGVTFSRASTGLFALLKALADKYGQGEVILPSLCCESVALAALYSGHKPRFADVSLETFAISLETVEALISKDTRAIIVVHLFGVDAKVEQFASLRRKYPDVAFVEDIAHAIGGKDGNGIFQGSHLDYTLLSFAQNKILPGDGGIILLPDESVVSAEELEQAIPNGLKAAPPSELFLSLRNLVHAVADGWRINPEYEVSSVFLPAYKYYRDVIIYSGSIVDEGLLSLAIHDLENSRLKRQQRYQFYRRAIKVAHVIPINDQGICWRCPVLFGEPASAVSATVRLRKAGLNASNHYFPLHLLFGEGECPVSEYISSRIVNLWVDDSISDGDMRDSVDIINSN